jgi:hypothetical protein
MWPLGPEVRFLFVSAEIIFFPQPLKSKNSQILSNFINDPAARRPQPFESPSFQQWAKSTLCPAS